jgi:hypothetical protein
MASGIQDALVQEFERNVYHLGQQKESRLLTAGIRVKYETAEKFSFNRLSAVNMAAKATPTAATPVSGVTHSTRVAVATPFHWGEVYGRDSIVRMLLDPASEAIKSASAAMGRQIDTIITAAADGSAATGQHGAGAAATLPAGQRLLANGTAGTGAGQAMTLTGLRAAKRLMDAAEVSDKRYIAVNAKAMSDLLKVTEVASADYNTVRALVQGDINTFMGFNFIRTERLPAGGAGGRNICVAWAEGAIGVGLPDSRFARVAEDPSASFSTRVYLEMTMGAVRIDDLGVVCFEIDDAA